MKVACLACFLTPKFETLATSRIADDTSVFNGSPAVTDEHFFLRSDQYAYCFGRK